MNRPDTRNFATLIFALSMGIGVLQPRATAAEPFAGIRRVVFLGDSITYSGQYIEDVETYLRLKSPGFKCEFLDLGLPSETVSGLSEPGHAGGAFPRPTLHERLDRVLAKTKPDMIIACYGMNDGIYYPFGEERFKAYQDGILLLREKAKAAGARVLHVTPPPFDAVPIKSRTLPAGLAEYKQPYEGYDDVLDRYSEWLVSKRADGWDVVDIHTPLRKHLDEARTRDPKFRLAGDGVHIDSTGHWLIARELLRYWKVLDPKDEKAEAAGPVFDAMPQGAEVWKLVQRRQRVLKDAWLNAVGHKRPGMTKGVAVEEAEKQASAIDEQIRLRLSSGAQSSKQ